MDDKVLILTDSSNDDVTTASVNPPVLMLARTGAPNPIEESCRLANRHKNIKSLTFLQLLTMPIKFTIKFEIRK